MTTDGAGNVVTQVASPDAEPSSLSSPLPSHNAHAALNGNPPNGAVVYRQALLLTTGVVLSATLCLVLWHSNRSATGTLKMRESRAAHLAADARTIATLRSRPHEATDVGLRRSDLLERVARAMQAAQLDGGSLVSTLPQPPRRRPGSDHAEVTHRLVLENVELKALVCFCHTLTTRSPELHVSGLQLRPVADTQLWNMDVSVSYWVLAPTRGS